MQPKTKLISYKPNYDMKEGTNVPDSKALAKNIKLNYLDRPKTKSRKYTSNQNINVKKL